jgi:uncharacterized membrane protein
VLAAGLVAAVVCAQIDAAPSYVATPLGTLGGNGSSANAINASGQVTGFSYVTKSTCPIRLPRSMHSSIPTAF